MFKKKREEKTVGASARKGRRLQTMLSFVLAVIMAFSTLAPLSAYAGQANPNGTKIDTYVKSGTVVPTYTQADLLPVTTSTRNNGDGTTSQLPATEPNKILRQDISKPVEFKLNVTFQESGSGDRIITIKKPYGSTFTIGTDASTVGALVTDTTRVTGTGSASSEVKLKLKPAGLNTMFELYYSISYSPNWGAPGNTTDFTPHLSVGGSEVAVGDTISVTEARDTEIFPGLRLSGDISKSIQPTNVNAGLASAHRLGFKATDLARSGVLYNYTMRGIFETFCPDAVIGEQAQISGRNPASATISITLPKEATVVNAAGYTTSTSGDGRTVLTGPMTGLDYSTANIGSSNAPYSTDSFTVSYLRAPDNGATAYSYDVTVEGSWYGSGGTFSETTTGIQHIYTAAEDANALNLTLTTRQSNKTDGNSRGLGYTLTYAASTLALKDYSNSTYIVENSGSANLKNVEVTIPFDGDIWDVKDFVLGRNTLTSSDLKDLTFVYSDNTQQTVQFSDSTKFTQADIKSLPSSSCTRPAINMESWVMNGKADSVYIKEIRLTLDSLSNAGILCFGLEGQLRATRHSGAAIITKPATNSDTTKTEMTATAVASADESKSITKSASSAVYPIYGEGENPLSMVGSINVIGDVGAQRSSGEKFTPYSYLGIYGGGSYDAKVIEPCMSLVVPDTYSVDNFRVYLQSVGGSLVPVTDSSLYRIDPVEHRTVDSGAYAGGYNVYKVTYLGSFSVLSGYMLRIYYDVTIPASISPGSGKIYSFWTEGSPEKLNFSNNGGSGDRQVDFLDLDGDGLTTDTLTARMATFSIVVPATLTVAESANGDKEASTVWKEDGVVAADYKDANLALVKDSGTLRLSIINGTDAAISGTSYAQIPYNAAYPLKLSGIRAEATNITTGDTSAATQTYYYTTSTAADLKTVPAGQWTAFTDPSTVPATARAIKFDSTSQSLPGHYRIDDYLTFTVPSGAPHGTIYRGNSQCDLSAGQINTNTAGFKVTKPKVTINYFEGTTSAFDLKGSVVEAHEYGEQMTLPLGNTTTSGSLNFKKPASGYADGVQQGTVPYVVKDGDETINTINVLYSKKTFTVPVEYYLEGESTPFETDTTTFAGREFGSVLSMTSGILNGHKPTKGYESGVADCGDTYTVADSATNKIKITYAKKSTLTARIVYHTGSATGPEIGRSDLITNQTFGSVVDPATYLDAKKPASGYDSGVAVGTWTVDDVALNEFHVYYPAKAGLPYTINYYNGSVSALNLIASEIDTGTASFGEGVTLTQAQLDAYGTPPDDGWAPHGQQTPAAPYVMRDSDNIIRVVYPRVGSIEVKVAYVKEVYGSTDTTITVDTLESTYEAGDVIRLVRELDNAFPGLGYTQGYQVGGDYTVKPTDDNTIVVRYDLDTDIPYIVEYYTEKADGSLDRVIMRSTVFFGTYTEPITLSTLVRDAESVPGYSAVGTQLDTPHILSNPVINTIKVSYPIRKDIPVTVNYYKDTVALANQLGTATLANKTFGESVSVPAGTNSGQIDAHRPAGYKSGEATPATIIVGASGNVINVVYTKSTYPVTVNYYRGSVNPSNFIKSASLGTREFQSSVVLTPGTAEGQLNYALPEAGYRDGVQQNALTVTNVNTNNTINVVYPIKGDLAAQVIYHKGSPSGPVIGYSPLITGLTTADTVDASAHLGTAPVGHKSGIAVGEPWTVADTTLNTFCVYYPVKDDLTYTIEYYKDSPDVSNLLDTEDGDEVFSFGDTVTLDDATLNAHKADLGSDIANYEDGVQEVAPYAMRDGDNVIRVVYPRVGSIQVKQRNIVKTMGEPDAVSYVTLFDQLAGDDIELTASTIAKYAPQDDHHGPGVQDPAPYTVKPTGENVFTVTWPCLHAAYTINYYTDAISSENLVWSSTTPAHYMIGEGITLSDTELTHHQPLGYGAGVQTPAGPYTLVANNNVINVVFPKKAEMSYTIEYYLEGSATSIASTQVTGAEFGSDIVIGTGDTEGEIDWKLPAEGYLSGVPNADNAKTVGDSAVQETVVKVTYPKKDFGITINYYTDSVSGTQVGTGSVASAKFDDVVSLTSEQLSANCPVGYAAPGTQVGGAYTVIDGTNTIDVVFAKKSNLMAQVVYHTGSVAGPVIGRSALIKSLTFDSVLTASDYLGTPPVGYKSGVAVATPWSVQDTDVNEFHVYYPIKDDLTYSVRYHTDSATGEVISTSAASATTHEFGEAITLSSAERDAERASLGPSYGAGVQVVTPYVMVDGTNIIDVYYPKLNNQSVTVKYVTETLSGDSTVTETLSGKNVDDVIEFTPSQIAAHAPSGSNHESGVQVGGPYTVTDGVNEITVRYALKSATYTINYYRDSVDAANYIAQANSVGTFKAGAGVTLSSGELSPSAAIFATLLKGYVTTGVQTPSAPFTLAPGSANTINVVFEPKAEKTVTITYHKDSAAGESVGTTTTVARVDDVIELDEVTRSAMCPTGYVSPGIQAGGAYTVTSGTNTIDVYFVKKTDLSAQVIYHTGSATGPVIGRSSTISGLTFDSVLSPTPYLGEFRPEKGYESGVASGTWTVDDVALNEFHVYYPRKANLSYTIEYYKDSVEGSNLIHTSAPVTGQSFESTVTLNASDLAAGKSHIGSTASNYSSGIQVDTPYTIFDGENVIRVVYPRVDNLSVEVAFVCEVAGSADTTITTRTLTSLKAGDTVDVTDSEMDSVKASLGTLADNYEDGSQVGGPYTVKPSDNSVVIVRYPLKSVGYTVNYYVGSVAGDPIRTVNSTSTLKVGSPLTLGTAELDLVRAGGVQVPATYTMLSSGNTVSVVYPDTSKQVLVKYYTQDLDLMSRTQIASSDTTLSGTFEVGDTIILTSDQRNAYRPARGFEAGEQSDASGYTVVDGTNIIEVTYPRKCDLSYQIEYRLVSSTGTVTAYSQVVPDQVFEDRVTLTKAQLNAFKPATGYKDGIQDGGLSTFSVLAQNTAAQSGVPYVIDDAANTIIVYYPQDTTPVNPANTAPKVTSNSVVHFMKGQKPTQAEFLKAIDAVATDKEDGTISVSKIKIEGWSSIKWDTVNYPGTPYRVVLTVTDSQGLESAPKSVAVFIRSTDTPLDPVDPKDPNIPSTPPSGYEWRKDAQGNYVLVKKGTKTTKVSSTGGSSNASTGDSDSIMLAGTVTAFVAAAGTLFFVRKRRSGATEEV